MINSPKLMEYVSVKPYLLSLVFCLDGFYIIVGSKNVSEGLPIVVTGGAGEVTALGLWPMCQRRERRERGDER